MMPDLLLEGDIAHIGCFEFKLIIFKYSVINLISNQEGVFHCVSYAWILSTLLPNNQWDSQENTRCITVLQLNKIGFDQERRLVCGYYNVVRQLSPNLANWRPAVQ